MIFFKLLAVVGIALAILAIYKRCYSPGVYASFMMVQCVAMAHTGWIILSAAVAVTVIALLLTEGEGK